MLHIVRKLILPVFFFVLGLGSGFLSNPVLAHNECPGHQNEHTHEHHKQITKNHQQQVDLDCTNIDCDKTHTCDCCAPHLFQQPLIHIGAPQATRYIALPENIQLFRPVINYESVYQDISQPPD